MGGLSIVAGSLASAAAVSAVLLRGSLPVPVLFLLGHAALTGCFIAASASDTFGERTSGLLGKVRMRLTACWTAVPCDIHNLGEADC